MKNTFGNFKIKKIEHMKNDLKQYTNSHGYLRERIFVCS